MQLLLQNVGRAAGGPRLGQIVAVPAFDPSSAAAAKQYAALAAEEHLGNLVAELYVAMPTLAACGFSESFFPEAASSNTAAIGLGTQPLLRWPL